MRLFRAIKDNFRKILLVYLSFLVIVLVSYFFAAHIVNQRTLAESEEVMNGAEATVRAYLSNSEVALRSILFAAEDLAAKDGHDIDKIRELLVNWTDWLEQQTSYSLENSFTGVYGYINSRFISGAGWQPPADYVPTNRPWYIGAMETDGIHFSSPYPDVYSGRVVMSIASRFATPNSTMDGVLALDLSIGEITAYMNGQRLVGDGYGILLNEELQFISHPDETVIGRDFASLSQRHADLAVEVEAGMPISARRVTSAGGVESILFLRPLYNGWYVGIITPARAYFHQPAQMALVLSLIGILMGTILSWFLVRLDSARQRSEDENRSKSTFLATMSHEIRTPMNAIMGMSELILREDISPAVYEHTVGIRQAGDNLLSLINDILDFSKIESGKMEIVETEYELASLLNDAISIVRMRTREKNLDLLVNIDSAVPARMTGDEIRIRQCVLNLLNNAVKYTSEGYISLTVSAENDLEDSTTILMVEVSDSGIGIREDEQAQLFGSFVQLDVNKNKGIEGSGLGLSITRNLCRAMGGDVTLESVYGEGSTFTLTLPQKFAAYQPIAQVTSPEKKSVLLYETRPLYAESIAGAIANLGVGCTLVTRQSDFLNGLQDGRYTYIFVPSFLFDSARSSILRLGTEVKLVMLAEYGETVAAPQVRTLSMPVHTPAIAAVLNHSGDGPAYSDVSSSHARFIAPTARILLVDDILTNLKVAQGLMAPYRMQIDACQSGAEAIRMVQTGGYDIVFMDHMMPEMDGIEATNIIRTLGGEEATFQNLPIIALTANAVSGMKEMFLNNGMTDFLAKPIEAGKLNAILDRYLPEEKKEKYQEETTTYDIVPITIEGVDTKKGLSMTGGDVEYYVSTLATFHSDAVGLIPELDQCLAEENLSLYTTYVHALKSACANIGATEVSELAKALEAAGKKEDTPYIAANHRQFSASLLEVVRRIKTALDSRPTATGGDKAADAGWLLPNLAKLSTALDELDIATVDEVLSDLRAAVRSGPLRQRLEDIGQNILMFEYEDAQAQIASLQAELTKEAG